jgi:hypothetical protein
MRAAVLAWAIGGCGGVAFTGGSAGGDAGAIADGGPTSDSGPGDAAGDVRPVGDAGRWCTTAGRGHEACWDFDDGVVPAPNVFNGASVTTDGANARSAPFSLLATAPAANTARTASATYRWARGKPHVIVAFDALLESPVGVYFTMIRYRSAAGKIWTISVLEDDGTIDVNSYSNHPATAIDQYLTTSDPPPTAWTRYELDVDISAFPTVGGVTTAVVSLDKDGTSRVNKQAMTVPVDFVPVETFVEVGVGYLANASTAARIRIDNVTID